MAKMDWGLMDTVKPEDMNSIGQEINELRSDIDRTDLTMDEHIAATTGVHGATFKSEPDRIITRDGNGQAKVGTPTEPEHIARLMDLSDGSRSATIIVAANNSSQKSKQGADFVVPDGVDNAQNTINAAINSLPPEGGKVLLMEGLYTVSGNILLPSNTTLEGMGASTVIKSDGKYANIYMIRNSDPAGNNNINVINLLFDGNKSIQLGDSVGVRFQNVQNGIISSVRAVNTKTTGIYVDGSRSLNNIITGNVCSGSDNYGIYVGGGRNTVIGNACNNSLSGIYISSTQDSGNTITGNTLTGNVRGIYMYGGSGNAITNNMCIGNNDYGIYITGSSKNNNITGNTCNNSRYGIYISGGAYSTITGNSFNNNSNGIYVTGTGSNNNFITGNMCFGSENGSGIEVAGDYNTITSNTIRRSDSNDSFGIRIRSGVGNMVTNNDLYKSGITAYSDGGTSTVTTPDNRT